MMVVGNGNGSINNLIKHFTRIYVYGENQMLQLNLIRVLDFRFLYEIDKL